MEGNELNISKLSAHLFWDIDVRTIDAEKDKQLIVHRVLEYGLLEDWVMIMNHFGIEEIAIVTMQIRELDSKSLTFIAAISKKPIELFRCFTTKHSTPLHWNF